VDFFGKMLQIFPCVYKSRGVKSDKISQFLQLLITTFQLSGEIKMKKTVCALLVLLGCGMVWAEETPLISGTAFQPKQWGEQYFAQGVTPPFSFVYGGEKSDKFINDWQFQSQNLSSSPSKDVAVFTYTDPKTGLAVKCEVTFFKDFPAVEWVLKFVNTSEKNTPILEKVKVIDHTFATDGGDLILHHSRGSDASRSDFAPMNDKIPVGEHIYMTPSCGRSSDTSAFPFFNIETPNKQGIVVAVGWTGKWYADVARSKNTAFTLESGMERMALTLYPHEEIRTPRICFLYWKGDDRMTGHNQFRRVS
jgi:alpha-galactosidase